MSDEENTKPQAPRMVITQTRGNQTSELAREQLEATATKHGWTDLEWETLEGGKGEPIDRLSGCRANQRAKPQASPNDNNGATIVS